MGVRTDAKTWGGGCETVNRAGDIAWKSTVVVVEVAGERGGDRVDHRTHRRRVAEQSRPST